MKKVIYNLVFVLAVFSITSASRAATVSIPFSDDFEGYADQEALNSVWTHPAQWKEIVLNTEQNHTPGGAQSVWSTRDADGACRYAEIQFSDDPIECSVEAWFYDTGEPDVFGAVIASRALSPTAPKAVVEVGLFPLGGGGGSTHYSYYDASGDWVRKNSGIARSEGWHKVNIIFAASGGAIYLDDTPLVVNSPNLPSGTKVWLGNPWGGVNPMYFDDVSVIPEPGTLAMLGLGGLALIRRRRRA